MNSLIHENETLILKYWHSWQQLDWDSLRACLAEELDFGGQFLSKEQFIGICQNGNPWQAVRMLASTFDEKGGAILYEGTDSVTRQTIRVGEFIKVENGQIKASIASFGSGQPPL